MRLSERAGTRASIADVTQPWRAPVSRFSRAGARGSCGRRSAHSRALGRLQSMVAWPARRWRDAAARNELISHTRPAQGVCHITSRVLAPPAAAGKRCAAAAGPAAPAALRLSFPCEEPPSSVPQPNLSGPALNLWAALPAAAAAPAAAPRGAPAAAAARAPLAAQQGPFDAAAAAVAAAISAAVAPPGAAAPPAAAASAAPAIATAAAPAAGAAAAPAPAAGAAGAGGGCRLTTLSPALYFKQRAPPTLYYGYSISNVTCRQLPGGASGARAGAGGAPGGAAGAALAAGGALMSSAPGGGQMGASYGLWVVPSLPSVRSQIASALVARSRARDQISRLEVPPLASCTPAPRARSRAAPCRPPPSGPLAQPAQRGGRDSLSTSPQSCRLAVTTAGKTYLSVGGYPCALALDPEGALGPGCCFGSPAYGGGP